MDYIKIPRHLIYKERTDLNDFGVRVPGTINHVLLSNLKELFKATDRLKEIILRCFNNAYYICTIIPFDDAPELQVAAYEELLLQDDNHYDLEEVVAVSMAMVNKLLPASNARWRPENSELTSTIRYRLTHYRWTGMGASKSFMFIDGKNNTDALTLPPGEFEPRDIIEVIDNSTIDDLQLYAEFICERLANLEDPHQRLYGADLAIARIRDDQRELIEDSDYDPKKDSFKYEESYFPPDHDWEDSVRNDYRQSKKALDYYTKHYPPKEENNSNDKTVETPQTSETDVLQATTSELDSKLAHRVDELQQQLTEKTQALQKALHVIEEYQQPVKELSAKQKIRMEFALQLLFNSGLTEEKFNSGYKSKVATLLSFLLGIGQQICYNYLVDRDYHPQKQDKEKILELDELCTELEIRAFLSTNPKGDKKG